MAYTPEVNHQAIAGLWKLTQIKSQYKPLVPMKEFTVFPKDKERERKQAAALETNFAKAEAKEVQEEWNFALAQEEEDGRRTSFDIVGFFKVKIY